MPTKAVPLETIQGGYRTALKGIGGRIIQTRRERQLSQGDLAAKINVGRGSIALWESGHTIPDLPALCFLSEKLGVSVHWLCFGDPSAGEGDHEDIPIKLVTLQPHKEPVVTKIIRVERQFIGLSRADYANLLGTTVTQEIANSRFTVDDVIIYDSAGNDPTVGGHFLFKSGSRLAIGELLPKLGEQITVDQNGARFDTTSAEITPYLIGRIVTHIHKW